MPHLVEENQPLLSLEEVGATAVYPIIHMIRADIMHFIDTPLSYEALTAPDLTYTLVRPLEEKYNAIQRQGNKSVVFCFLVNRVRFIRDQNLATTILSRSRAALCEILAIRTMREHADSMLDLALAITTSWAVYSGCDPMLMAQAREERDAIEDRVGNAIEMAIISKAKRFIKSSPCQKVIDAIWTGKCVYQAQSSHSILSDTYKITPIHFYDPHKAPLLDHYRLKVPAIRSVLEYINFVVLFILFVIALELNERDRINLFEIIFMVYGLGFTLEKIAAMQEHGIRVFFKGTWNGFDVAFVSVYFTYISLRLYGVYSYNLSARQNGIDCLALIACFMFPRLAFVTLRNNLMVLALRAMLVQFVALMLIAAFCFGGFLYALWTLSRSQAHFSVGTIAWWMLDLWFGLDASAFDKATQFHPSLGPIMVVTYACLSNTLLLTVLVSILSHTFSTINEDAAAEAMFRKAVSTIEGVKADFLFSYQPPVNVFALCIMLPARYILTPRWFHKVNVFMIRATSFPFLLCIAWYERQAKRSNTFTFYETILSAAEKLFDSLPRRLRRITIFEGLAGADADIDAIFELNEDGDSADDQRDLTPSEVARQRRLSQFSYRRSSGGSEREPSPVPHQFPQPSPSPSMRPRLNSLVHKGVEMGQSVVSSPLAQIFQPLVVDDDVIPEEPEESQSSQSANLPLLSYGPASRRRLISMSARRPGSDIFAPPSAVQGAGIRWGSIVSSRLTDPQVTSHNPEQQEQEDEPQPETAQQVEDEEQRGGGEPRLMRRLIIIEERQKRIEDLLIELNKRL